VRLGELALLEKIRDTVVATRGTMQDPEDSMSFYGKAGGSSTRESVAMAYKSRITLDMHSRPTTTKRDLRNRRVSTAWNAFGSDMTDWMQNDAKIFMPWKDDSTEARKYVKNLDQERVLSTWGALYCGGQGPLADALEKTTKDFGISVALESFKW